MAIDDFPPDEASEGASPDHDAGDLFGDGPQANPEEEEVEGENIVDGNSDSEEEEGEDVAAYVDDGFVVDEEEDEADFEGNALLDSEEEEKRKKKRKRKKSKDYELDDDDFDLLEEAGERFQRPHPSRKRRLKKRGGDEGLENPADANQLHEHLFGEDYEVLEDELGDDQQVDEYDPQQPADDEMIDHDGLDDFIVRDGQDQGRSMSMFSGHNERAMQEVCSIFGDYEHLIDLFDRAKQQGREEEEMGSDMDEEGRARRRSSISKAGLDPAELKLHGLLPEDDLIRKTDVPERFQKRLGLGPSHMDFSMAAEWIYDKVFSESSQMRLEKFTIFTIGRREIDGPTEHDTYNGKKEDAPCSGHRVLCERDDEGESVVAQDELRTSIQCVLEHIFKKNEEVPYIGTYCKDICGDLLCLERNEKPGITTLEEYNRHRNDGMPWFPPGAIQAKHEILRQWLLLWAVYEWGLKWRRFAHRVEKRAEVFQQALEKCTDQSIQQKIEWCVEHIHQAQTMEDVDDIDRMFEMLINFSDAASSKGAKKKSSKILSYCRYNTLGLSKFLSELGLQERLFQDGGGPRYSHHWSVGISDFVSNFKTTGGLDNTKNILTAARQMAATELACTPAIRRRLRDLYMKHAVVNTDPTESGEQALDPFHVYGVIKRLKNKPIVTFDDTDLYLKIVGASNDGLIKYKFGVPSDVFETVLLRELKTELLLDGFDEGIHPEWAKFREDVIRELALGHLFPSLEREFKQKLAEGAREFIKQQMAKNLWSYATKSPFKATTSGEDGEEETVEATRVCACCWGPGVPSTVLVMLDSHGQLVDVLHVKQFSGEVPRAKWGETEPLDVFEDDAKAQDAAQVRDFLMEHKPHVIAVGATNLACRQLLADMKSIRDHFLSEHARFMVSIQGNMEVVFANESVAVLWENSNSAKTELPDHPGIVKRAVALGRTLIDPLAVLASLRDHSDTILSLHLYDMQKMVSREEHLFTIDQVMVTAVNQLGAELNVMANVTWRAPSLQFLAGLGPRKAQGLLSALQRNGNRVESRWELMQLNVLGKRVARNCTGFLRIDSGNLKGLDNMNFDILDNTRIHPEHYEIAKSMAMSVVGEDDGEAAIKTVSIRPREVEAFDLMEFNSHLMEDGKGSRLSLLIDIQMELIGPFHDRREGYQIPKEIDVFHWLANETPQVLKPGYLTEAVVRRVEPDQVFCNLTDSRLDGFIKKENFSSSNEPYIDLKARTRPGMVIHARIHAIDYKNMTVELTSRKNDLNNIKHWEERYYGAVGVVEYYDFEQKENPNERAEKTKKTAKSFTPRLIDHPLFKNISANDATAELKDAPPGTCILRPSSRSIHYICLSIKLFDGHRKIGGVVEHRELMEGEKGQGKGAHLKLGLPLTMHLTSSLTMTFDDLDEVIAHFVEPYMEKIGQILKHRKFNKNEEDEIKHQLLAEKHKLGRQWAVYCLGVDYKRPGLFFVGSILSSSLNREGFTVVQDGFYYRRNVYKTVEHIIQVFKKSPYVSPTQAQDAPAQSNGGGHRQGQQPYGGGGHRGGRGGASFGGYPGQSHGFNPEGSGFRGRGGRGGWGDHRGGGRAGGGGWFDNHERPGPSNAGGGGFSMDRRWNSGGRFGGGGGRGGMPGSSPYRGGSRPGPGTQGNGMGFGVPGGLNSMRQDPYPAPAGGGPGSPRAPQHDSDSDSGMGFGPKPPPPPPPPDPPKPLAKIERSPGPGPGPVPPPPQPPDSPGMQF